MSNIISVKGVSADSLERKIWQMNPGEVGYAVEWAVQNGELNENRTIEPRERGTANMKVICVRIGKYQIEYKNLPHIYVPISDED